MGDKTDHYIGDFLSIYLDDNEGIGNIHNGMWVIQGMWEYEENNDQFDYLLEKETTVQIQIIKNETIDTTVDSFNCTVNFCSSLYV